MEADAQLWRRVQQGDEEAFASLYDEWVDRVYSIACFLLGDADEAEAVVEETFTRIWREAHQYDTFRESVGPWVVLIARAAALSRRRPAPPANEPAAHDPPVPPRPRTTARAADERRSGAWDAKGIS